MTRQTTKLKDTAAKRGTVISLEALLAYWNNSRARKGETMEESHYTPNKKLKSDHNKAPIFFRSSVFCDWFIFNKNQSQSEKKWVSYCDPTLVRAGTMPMRLIWSMYSFWPQPFSGTVYNTVSMQGWLQWGTWLERNPIEPLTTTLILISGSNFKGLFDRRYKNINRGHLILHFYVAAQPQNHRFSLENRSSSRLNPAKVCLNTHSRGWVIF